jgi:formylglycine-generating enzyme required for sulfatase activity
MVLVEAGDFQMGDDTHSLDERPLHMVSLPAFYIDRYEVTNRQYRGFCDAAQHPYPASWQGAVSSSTSEPDYPVVGIEFDDAAAFAASVGKRLPTEQEWEKAAGWDPARPGRRVYPWGDEFIPNQANTTFNKPTSVGKYSGDKSAYGAFDMAGNAPEWVDAIYGAYPNSSFQQTRDTVGNGVVRGFVLIAERTNGFKASEWTRAALRGPLPRRFPQGGAILVGARCAISADDPRLRDNINARIREGAGGSR